MTNGVAAAEALLSRGWGTPTAHVETGPPGSFADALDAVNAMRAWLAGGMIPDDRELMADLTGVEYGYVLREGRDAIILEKKRT